MAKGSKVTSGKQLGNENKNKSKTNKEAIEGDYLVGMSAAPRLGQDAHWFQMVPIVFFTAVIIMITHMVVYERPMKQFLFWDSSSNQLNDFFSYGKMVAILICASFILVILLYRVFVQAFYIKRSFAYVPMIVYIVLVLLSYAFSDYKDFAMWGWIDRFEGTLTLLAYMIMLFYVINTVNSEKNVKWIVYSLAATSSLLGLLGVSQALNHDFFKTLIGKKLITPPSFWGNLDSLNFTFTTEIYQTVYNINYVSFYLTLLIPIFGLLFIRSVMQGKEESIYKKVIWGAVFALLVFNLIGSSSSGGYMGMAFVILAGLIVLNKRILTWWKPVVILVAITVIITGVSFQRWMPELSSAVDSVMGKQVQAPQDYGNLHKIDYIVTSGDAIILSYKGEPVTFTTYKNDPSTISITDSKGTTIGLTPVTGEKATFQLKDDRFNWITVRPAKDSKGFRYFVIRTDQTDWNFRLTNAGPMYLTGLQKLISLRHIPAIGWENNPSFGSGRGYIWSRTLPMLKDTLILGHGADTYCIYFPNDDYVGKYDSGTFTRNINIIVDKPHNMYFGATIGTGALSVLALLVLWGIYLVQSFNIYRKEKYRSFLSYAGVGIFLGIFGFLVSALVNDSNVSVMPMFYGLLGTGISINIMLKRRIVE